MKPTIMRRSLRRDQQGSHRATRLVVIAVVLAVAASLASAATAWAAGETIGGCALEKAYEASVEYGSIKAVKESPHAAEEVEADLESCLEAPSPIFPEVDEIIWGGAAFLILFAFMWRYGMPGIKRAMDARSEKIRADLDAADAAKTQAQRTKAEYEAQLADAKATAAAIIDDARVSADRLGQELQARAEAEIAEQRARAATDIEASRRQAIEDLRSDVATIAVGAAERVVSASLDAEVHRAIIDSYIDEVAGAGATSNGS